MPQYLLLLHEASKVTNLSPDAMQAIIQKYKAWSDKLKQTGRLVDANKLCRDGRVMRGVTVINGPYAEAKEVIGGYFMIEAANYDQAVQLARDCPNLELGGTIEVREIESC
ncbi:MAG: transcription initiation protein [Nitrospirae bacterium]|nr:transcription initiation protein [Nitrospirota bacterium]